MTRWIVALALVLVAATSGLAQPVPVPETWGGDLLSRPRLTGSWGGLRDEMARKGQGVMASRPHDSFGVGWARTEFSGNFLPFLRDQLNLGLGREDAVELYYNAAVTGWLQATLDLQIVEPAVRKTLNSSTQQLEHVGTTVVPEVRLYMRF